MASKNETVYGKYRVLDAKTGEEKHGRYFVLKVDASDPNERNAVFEALFAYAKCQAAVGRKEYADEVMRYAESK